MCFYQIQKIYNYPSLILIGTKIPLTHEYNFLSSTFALKLSFSPNIKHVVIKGNQTIQLLRSIAKPDWGADKKNFIELYRSLMQSKLDYGSYILRETRESYCR